MKHVYLSLSFIFAVLIGTAQTVIIPSEIAVEGITSADTDIVGDAVVVNQSDDEQSYQWTRTIIDLADGWNTAVCDVNLCYGPTVDQANFALSPGQEGTLDVHVYPGGNEGAAIVSVTVVNVNNAEDNATAIYYFNQALSVPEVINNALKIYPNPVADQFFVEGGDKVERLDIYNLEGKLVKEFRNTGSTAMDVSELPTGNYIVRMWNESNQQISTNILSVQ